MGYVTFGSRGVSVSEELVLDVLDLSGDSRSVKHLEKLAENPSDVVANTRFLGRVEVPLAETLTASPDGRWYTLMRRSSGDNVTGQVRPTREFRGF